MYAWRFNRQKVYVHLNGIINKFFQITGSLTAVEELDFELRKTYELTVRATDIQTGSYAEAIVHVQLEVNIYQCTRCSASQVR